MMFPDIISGSVWTLFVVIFAVWLVLRHIRVVPQQTAFIIERLGRYHATYDAGIHFLTPLIDRIAYKILKNRLNRITG